MHAALRPGSTPPRPPARTALATVATHGGATVSHGRVADGVGANAVRAAVRGLESPSVSTGWARPAGIMKTLEARMTWPRRIGGAMAFAPGYEDAAYVGKPGPGSINLDQRLQPVAAMAAARLAVEREHTVCRVQVAQPDRARITPSLPERPFAARTSHRLFHGNAAGISAIQKVPAWVAGTTSGQATLAVPGWLRYTIEEHFRKQARFRDEGIKVLSLFFIDKVNNYVAEDGVIRELFDRTFNELKAPYPEWRDRNPEEVRAAYFATKSKRDGAIEYLDSTGKSKADEKAFSLIMQRKEDLLSFEEPVSFIFSHSALREGWDNPNVFQICTMREVGSDTERRQQVGRGVRLPVNQEGKRIQEERINVLTVVASETFERFVTGLQSDIEAEYGKDGTPPKPPDARKKTILRLRKARTLKPEFMELWDRIKYKTRYAVSIDSSRLIKDAVPLVSG